MICKGMNCGTTDGNHSPECVAENAAAVAGGRFVKGSAVDRGEESRDAERYQWLREFVCHYDVWLAVKRLESDADMDAYVDAGIEENRVEEVLQRLTDEQERLGLYENRVYQYLTEFGGWEDTDWMTYQSMECEKRIVYLANGEEK